MKLTSAKVEVGVKLGNICKTDVVVPKISNIY